ncbi:MAG: hypothetical protein GDA53_10200 [Rhodobacteraceae bacterium]|nr:hypothetical protein [Paracoccaceae bacterium]
MHNRPGSGGFAVQATLAVAGLDFAYDPIASRPGQHLGTLIEPINPWGQVPVPVLEDGTRITETAAILLHLAAAEPTVRNGPGLWVDNQPLFVAVGSIFIRQCV